MDLFALTNRLLHALLIGAKVLLAVTLAYAVLIVIASWILPED